jgi:hypothetical protein
MLLGTSIDEVPASYRDNITENSLSQYEGRRPEWGSQNEHNSKQAYIYHFHQVFSFLFLHISDILAHTYFSSGFYGFQEYKHAAYVIIINKYKACRWSQKRLTARSNRHRCRELDQVGLYIVEVPLMSTHMKA